MTAEALMLGALVKQVYKGKSSLKEFAPEDIAFSAFTVPSGKQPRGSQLDEWLGFIHYSWMQDVFKKVPDPLRPYLASVLTEVQSSGLGLTKKELAPPLKAFFAKELFARLAAPDVLPYSLLPSSALDTLLFMNKARVVHLIDLLGVQDVALDFKKVIDKEIQVKLASLLSPLQRQYLTYCFKETLIPLQQGKAPSYWLEHTSPRILIHSAGLWRLARLIGGEEKSWQWYFIHYLDQGRGSQMQKWIEQDKDIALQGKARDKILEQVLRLIEALK